MKLPQVTNGLPALSPWVRGLGSCMDYSFLFPAAILKETDGRKHLEENIVRLRKDQKGLLQDGLSAKTFQVRGLFSQLKLKGEESP